MTKAALITTTINYPELLIEYARDFKTNNKRRDLEVIFIIAGDIKTPKKTKLLANYIYKKFNIKCLYMDKKLQDQFLDNFKSLKKFLPWNSVQRRNVAILKSIELKCDIVITIDDDNFLKTKNFINSHLSNLENKNNKIVKSETKWFNICRFLEEENNNNFFHRGFPVSKKNYQIIINL